MLVYTVIANTFLSKQITYTVEYYDRTELSASSF